MAKQAYYPAFLNLAGRKAVVIGGGEVAEGKVSGLLEAGAAVTVVSPGVTPGLRRLAEEGCIGWSAREYRVGDLAGSWLAIAATGEASVNAAAAAEAKRRGILANVVDSPALCSFIAPAVVRRGDLTLAVSTGGESPAFARRVREELEELFPEEHGVVLEITGRVRASLRREGVRAPRDVWRRALQADIVSLIKSGEAEAAEEALMRALRAESPTPAGTRRPLLKGRGQAEWSAQEPSLVSDCHRREP